MENLTEPSAVADKPAPKPAAEAGQQFVTTATGVKQTLCPPNAPQYDPTWFDERERYLLTRGWEREEVNAGLPTYRDPKGSRLRGEMRHVADLPNKGDDLHKTKPVYQFHVPATTYSYTLEEALDMQRRRDVTGGDGPTPLERLGACEDRCNDLEEKLERIRARLNMLLKAHPISLEGLKLGLRELIGE